MNRILVIGAHSTIAMACARRWAADGAHFYLLAHGTLPDQAACERDPALAMREFSTNGLSVIALLTALGPLMQMQAQP